MTAAFHEFERTDEHGLTRKELNRLIDDILDYLIEQHDEGPRLRKVTVNVTVQKAGNGV